MQKSQQGLLQCLLYEILKQRKDLMPRAFPGYWNSASTFENPNFTWVASDLTHALESLASTEFETRFFFMIDGLDEFDGDHQTLVDSLFRITSNANVKVLASSRPWLVFQDAFETAP